MKPFDLVIIGGGPAGLAAALNARKQGVKRILILERDKELGGILNQCVHNGFGIHRFKAELTGPEYSMRFIHELHKTDIEYKLNTMVLKIDENRCVYAINDRDGYLKIPARAIILAMGCRERTRSSVNIQGNRPAGIYTAGTAQRLVNMEGYLPGKNVVILGTGDIGLIMARRLTLEGANVKVVYGRSGRAAGLTRNVVQCLHDFDIPLKLKHTITSVHGRGRIEAVSVTQLDDKKRPISDSLHDIECDTLLLSVGLIPENDISERAHIELDSKTAGALVGEYRQTNREGIFSCGNVLHVHDLADFASDEADIAGEGAAKYLRGELESGFSHRIKMGYGVSSVVPQKMNINNVKEKVLFYLRVNDAYEKTSVSATVNGVEVANKKEIKFLPSEMVRIEISKEALMKLSSDEIIFEVKA